MRFRPCIDLHGGQVKQIVGGTLTDGATGQEADARENFVSDRDASWYASLYKERNLTGGHVIKLGQGNDEQARKALKAWPGGLQVGGGIDRENAADWLEEGASHVIVTSCLFEEGRLSMDKVRDLSRITGPEHLVIDLSCRRRDNEWIVVTDRWQTYTDFALTSDSLAELGTLCDEYLIHGVDVEGKQSGIEDDLVKLLARETTRPVTYAGGIASLDDIDKIRALGKGRLDFTIGSALDIFGGSLSFEEIAAIHE